MRSRRSAHRNEAQPAHQIEVAVGRRIGRGEELRPVEDRVGAGEEAQRLGLLAHVLAAGREAHHRPRHRDAGGRNGAHEVDRIVAKQEEKSEKAPDLKIPFAKGDRVKVIEGNFENFEGEVENIDKTNGRVTVMITIFNRTTPVEFEYWQVELL